MSSTFHISEEIRVALSSEAVVANQGYSVRTEALATFDDELYMQIMQAQQALGIDVPYALEVGKDGAIYGPQILLGDSGSPTLAFGPMELPIDPAWGLEVTVDDLDYPVIKLQIGGVAIPGEYRIYFNKDVPAEGRRAKVKAALADKKNPLKAFAALLGERPLYGKAIVSWDQKTKDADGNPLVTWALEPGTYQITDTRLSTGGQFGAKLLVQIGGIWYKANSDMTKALRDAVVSPDEPATVTIDSRLRFFKDIYPQFDAQVVTAAQALAAKKAASGQLPKFSLAA